MSLQHLIDALQLYPELSSLDFNGLNLFIRYATLAKPAIEFTQLDKQACPTSLSPQVLQILAAALEESETNLIEVCWSVFQKLVWNQPVISPTETKYGLQ
ncbi:hypothetical protein B0H10DRAFT_1856638 [Mycena sp. CBHHK59/15]|nr:hypothetical protein B0H10DRAFT_1856638 [Mycena sp. CBHHK59/15]